MDSVQMHIDFRVKFNKVNSNKNKSFLPQEIDLFLNDQMDKFVEIRTTPKSNHKQEGFEESQKRLDDVRTVIKEGTTNASDSSGRTLLTLNTFTYGKYINLPADYLKLVNDWSDTSTPCSNHFMSPNRLYSSAILYDVLKDEFHRTHPKSPVSQIMNGQLRVYAEEFTITNIHISYVYKYPKIVYNTQSCVLPDHTHREIVDMAVAKVNSVINTDNYEKYINEINKNE